MPAKRAEFERRIRGELPAKLAAAVTDVKQKLAAAPKEIATRAASEFALETLDGGAAGNDRRLGRPHRLEQHPHQGDEGAEAAITPAPTSITACASTAWRRR